MWGHRVADRAVDFLRRVGNEPFVLVTSFDEPHGPLIAPPEYWEKFTGREIPRRPNYNAPIDGKPDLLKIQRKENGEVEWWYDGKRYLEDLGIEEARKIRRCRTPDELREAGATAEKMWGHRVADRAVDFLRRVGNEPFVLVTSFDEPHGPLIAPPEYWEKFTGREIPRRPNYNAPIDGKPDLLKIQRKENGEVEWEDYLDSIGISIFR
ncbi:unnamed protein product [marine sediment metagenome]|uniref:Uncharacterized protein n=1 Tax=marine sediment metagenome TaxID=412755 RepID=X0ZEZ1_9ZZZZ